MQPVSPSDSTMSARMKRRLPAAFRVGSGIDRSLADGALPFFPDHGHKNGQTASAVAWVSQTPTCKSKLGGQEDVQNSINRWVSPAMDRLRVEPGRPHPGMGTNQAGEPYTKTPRYLADFQEERIAPAIVQRFSGMLRRAFTAMLLGSFAAVTTSCVVPPNILSSDDDDGYWRNSSRRSRRTSDWGWSRRRRDDDWSRDRRRRRSRRRSRRGGDDHDRRKRRHQDGEQPGWGSNPDRQERQRRDGQRPGWGGGSHRQERRPRDDQQPAQPPKQKEQRRWNYPCGMRPENPYDCR